MRDKITIGITDCSKFKAYHDWVALEPGVEIIKLSHHDSNLASVEKCDGVVLTGGEDVHPRYYRREEYMHYCEIDEKRDDFELKVLERVESSRLPLFGICRGLQIANVFYGGTLIPHIPAFGKFDHARNSDSDRYHAILVDSNSRLKSIVGTDSGEVNSAHHQAADRIAPGLVANALSADGIVEGIEREANKEANKEGPFLQLVQWHPERMTDLTSVFSNNLQRAFIAACKSR